MERETFESLMTSYANRLVERHRAAAESEARSDRLVTWVIGFAGVGILAAPVFLAGFAISVSRKGLLVAALVPWVLAVVLGVMGRLFALERGPAYDAFFSAKLRDVELLLLETGAADALLPRFAAIARNEGEHKMRLDKAERLRVLSQGFYYLAYVGLGLGLVSLMLFAALA